MKTEKACFSLNRVAELYRYNAPWIRKQTTIYFLFSLAASILYLLIPSYTTRLTISGSCSTVLLFMFIWAPIVFTQGGDTRIIDRLIPASPSEKLVFYMSYLFIVIGLACYFCPWTAERISYEIYPGDEGFAETIRTSLDIPGLYECSQYLSTIAAMMTCFYCVVALRRDRVMKAYLISTCVLILTSSLNMFYGIKESVVLGFRDATVGRQPNETEIVEKMYSALNDHMSFFILCIAVISVYIIVLMWQSYRSLYRRNL